MFFSNPGAYSALSWFFEVLAISAFVVEVWAFIDATRRPAPAFIAAGKLTKPLWLIILGVATVIGLYTAASGSCPWRPSWPRRCISPTSSPRSAVPAAGLPGRARTAPGKASGAGVTGRPAAPARPQLGSANERDPMANAPA